MTSDRLEDLFVRYWDNALSDKEWAKLERGLVQNPDVRDGFRLLTLQAVYAGDLSEVGVASPPSPAPAASPLSRRQAVRYAVCGITAATAGGLAASWLSGGLSPTLTLAVVRGTVRMQTADGLDVSPTGPVPPGGTVVTTGVDASAVLTLPQGGTVTLAGDTAITLASTGLRLILRQGNAIAMIRGRPKGAESFELATSAATLTDLVEALITVGHGHRETEVGVREGSVTVSSPTGEPIGVVREGDMVTVRVDGRRATRPLPATPDEYSWNLDAPLPDGWAVGERVVDPKGPTIRPNLWFDPYHQARMWQIRSDHPWARGLCKIYPDSLVRMRYQADRPGDVEVVFCVREDQLPNAKTGCLGCVRPVTATSDENGHWWEANVADLLRHREAPKYGPPWVGFLAIVNTYKANLGLRVAEFRVTRPGGPRGD